MEKLLGRLKSQPKINWQMFLRKLKKFFLSGVKFLWKKRIEYIPKFAKEIQKQKVKLAKMVETN